MAKKRPKGSSGRVIAVAHRSAVLADNPLGDPVERVHDVWLPAQYDEARGRGRGRRFPVLFDLVGYNYKEHLYEEDHRRFPKMPIVGSENGHSYANWLAVTRHDFVAGQFLWTGIDYLGESTWPFTGFASGALDMIGHPKDAYYLWQSQWTDRPVLPLFPHWNWPGCEGQVIPVLAYTSCNAVELFLSKLKPDGVVLLHTSNRYLDLNSVLASILKELPPGTAGLAMQDAGGEGYGQSGSSVVVFAKSEAALQPYRSMEGVLELEDTGLRAWTDDYSDILGAFLSRFQGRG